MSLSSPNTVTYSDGKVSELKHGICTCTIQSAHHNVLLECNPSLNQVLQLWQDLNI